MCILRHKTIRNFAIIQKYIKNHTNNNKTLAIFLMELSLSLACLSVSFGFGNEDVKCILAYVHIIIFNMLRHIRGNFNCDNFICTF